MSPAVPLLGRVERELEAERLSLEQADTHILASEKRLIGREDLFANLDPDDLSTQLGRRLVGLLVNSLSGWRGRRVLILERIAALERTDRAQASLLAPFNASEQN